jgi:DNA-binding response OmpR family regulator
MRLLLVEDDARLASAVRSWMGLAGIDADWVTDGRAALAALQARPYDWMTLDLGLPDGPGDETLRRVREAGFDLPVVVITAREQVQDRVRLLDLGADDFLVKPVHLDELAARLRALQRRGGARAGGEHALRHGALCLMPASGSSPSCSRPTASSSASAATSTCSSRARRASPTGARSARSCATPASAGR